MYKGCTNNHDSTTGISKDSVVLSQCSSRYLVSWPLLLQIQLTVTMTGVAGTAIATCTFKLFTVRCHHFCKHVRSREEHPNSKDFEGELFFQLKIIMPRRATPSFVGRGLPMHGIDYHHTPAITWQVSKSFEEASVRSPPIRLPLFARSRDCCNVHYLPNATNNYLTNCRTYLSKIDKLPIVAF